MVTNKRPDINDPQTYAIIGAAMAVHRELGCGFLEAVYRAALKIELDERAIPYVCEVQLPIRYRTHVLPVTYRVEFVCYGDVLVELKAVQAIGPIEHAQAINYVRAARHKRGLLINFGATSLEHKRIACDLKQSADV